MLEKTGSRTHVPGNHKNNSSRCLESLLFMSNHTRNRSFQCSWFGQFIREMYPKASEMKPRRRTLTAKRTQVRVSKTIPKTVTRKVWKCVQKVSTNEVLQRDFFVFFQVWAQRRPGVGPRTSPGTLQGSLLFKIVKKDVFEM